MLADLGEFDARRLYLPKAYPSMHAYCVDVKHMTPGSAYKRIRVARTARRFPAVFFAVAEGRLHLSAVLVLKPYLTPETADELLAAATHKSKSEIERLVAQRFPQPHGQARIEGPLFDEPLSPGTVEIPDAQLPPGTLETLDAQLSPGTIGDILSRPNAAPERVMLQVAVRPSTRDKLRRSQELLSHQIPSGDWAEVLDRVLDLANRQLEKRKFAATENPRSKPRTTTSARHIPAHVKRAVRERDQDQCTFTSEAGRRCAARRFLEFDHVDPVARGGRASVDGVRLRCRAHNQYEAERVFGAEFMSCKREQAQLAAAKARAAKVAAQARAATEARAAEAQSVAKRTQEAAAQQAQERDVVPWLLRLGLRAREARDAARLCESIPDAPLEERVRVALSYFGSRAPSHSSATNPPGRAA